MSLQHPTPSEKKGIEDDLRNELEATEQELTSLNPDGRGKHRRALERFATLDPKAQHVSLRETWKEVAMGVALRAKAFATTCSPKDFGRLYQLVGAGATALEKAFPARESQGTPRLVVNLFGSLGQRAAAIAIPKVPQIVEATEVKDVIQLQPSPRTIEAREESTA